MGSHLESKNKATVTSSRHTITITNVKALLSLMWNLRTVPPSETSFQGRPNGILKLVSQNTFASSDSCGFRRILSVGLFLT
jgi:hypothetical protein